MSKEIIIEKTKEVIAEHPKQFDRYKSGESYLQSMFIGEVVKKTRGKVDIKIINILVKEILDKTESDGKTVMDEGLKEIALTHYPVEMEMKDAGGALHDVNESDRMVFLQGLKVSSQSKRADNTKEIEVLENDREKWKRDYMEAFDACARMGSKLGEAELKINSYLLKLSDLQQRNGEDAIAFAEWLEKGYWCKSNDTRFPQSYGLWYDKPNPNIPRSECKTTEELFTLFKSEQLTEKD